MLVLCLVFAAGLVHPAAAGAVRFDRDGGRRADRCADHSRLGEIYENVQRFSLGGGAQSGPFGIPSLKSAPVSEKRVALSRSSANNAMGIECRGVLRRRNLRQSGGQLAGIGWPKRALERSPQPELSAWPPFSDVGGQCGVSVAIPRRCTVTLPERRSWVMMYPEPAGRLWAARGSRSPP
jgi:hypothetical protein